MYLTSTGSMEICIWTLMHVAVVWYDQQGADRSVGLAREGWSCERTLVTTASLILCGVRSIVPTGNLLGVNLWLM